MFWVLATAAAAAMTTGGAGCEHPPGKPQSAVEKPATRPTTVPGEYLVTVIAPADARVVTDTYGRFGIKRVQDLGGNVFLVTLAEDPGLARLEDLRRQEPRIQAVQPNFVYKTQATDRPGEISPPAPKKEPVPLAPPSDGGRQ